MIKFKLLHGGCMVPGPNGPRHATTGDVVELSLADATRIEGEDAKTQHLQPVDAKLAWGPLGPIAAKPEPKPEPKQSKEPKE